MLEKRVLLVGTSYSAAPLLSALKAMEWHVAVCGAKADDPCVQWADEYFPVDYSDSYALGELVRELSFDFVCPSCNDYSYISAARVADDLGLPGFDSYESTMTLHDKEKFRHFCARHGLPAPKAQLFDPSLPESVDPGSYPLLVKPADSFSGKGITKVDEPRQLAAAVELACNTARGNSVVVEEFVDGTLHSHSAFLSEQEIMADFFVDEFCTVYPYQVNCSSSPATVPLAACERVREAIRQMAKELQLTDGLLHTQFLLRGGEVYLVECMRRCPGDLYYHLVSLSANVPYVDNYLRPFLGEAMQFPGVQELTPWARHTLSLPVDAVVRSFTHWIPSSEVEVFPISPSGSFVRHAPFGKVAILFARFNDAASLRRVTPKLHDFVSIDT